MEKITRVLLYSGGWDSTLASYIYPDAYKLYIDLKTPYSEIEKSHLPDDVKIIELDLNQFVMTNGHHIPQRNAIMALIATGYAMTFRNLNIEIILGGVKEDVNMSDKNPQYFKYLENLINMFYDTKSNQSEFYIIKVIGFFDDDKISLWHKAGKPNMRNVISCFDSSGFCGKCLDCKRRLLLLNHIYPGEYEIDEASIINDLKINNWLITDKLKIE